VSQCLKVSTAIELYLNTDQFIYHNVFEQDYGFLSQDTAFNVSLKDEVVEHIEYPSDVKDNYERKNTTSNINNCRGQSYDGA